MVGASTLSRIIRTLLPQSQVPFQAILQILAALRSLPFSVQQLLLRWTVLVFDLVDDIAPLRSVYDAVFYHLQVDELRSVVCQLLCYLTARSHVTEWRVQRLLELQKQVAAFKGSEPPLTGLLTVYRLHRPDLVGAMPHTKRKVYQLFHVLVH